MPSHINPLIPRYALEIWDGLIPYESSVSDETYSFKFNTNSTRVQMSPLWVNMSIYCCSSNTDFSCGDGTDNSGTLFIFFEIFNRFDGLWLPMAWSSVIYDKDITSFYCYNRMQTTKCGNTYDSAVYDIDLYGLLLNWTTLSLSHDGDITSTRLHNLIINDEDVCSVKSPPLDFGKILFLSLLGL
jgi:hypothetical protein